MENVPGASSIIVRIDPRPRAHGWMNRSSTREIDGTQYEVDWAEEGAEKAGSVRVLSIVCERQGGERVGG